jgi:hypothetical protein
MINDTLLNLFLYGKIIESVLALIGIIGVTILYLWERKKYQKKKR